MKLTSRISLFFLILGSIGLAAAQPNVCVTTATPVILRSEGLTERVGDIVYNCSSAPGATLKANFSVQLSTDITNRISSGNLVTGIVFTTDNGSGPQPALVQPVLLTQNTLVWNGVTLNYSAQGSLVIRIAGVRSNATEAPIGGSIFAFLAVNGQFGILQSMLTVAIPQRSLYVGYSAKLLCALYGSPLPDAISFTNLILSNSIFTTTRITEGFAGAFSQRSAQPNLNADSGTRFIVVYSGFPQPARLFVPDVVAGSDAIQPTAGGDFGLPASGGAYAPSTSGSLLLARVAGADATGAGGSPVYLPGMIGSGTVAFDSASELQIVNGVAFAVYEVVDANPITMESAQFPTFLGLAPNAVPNAVQTNESVTYAPVSIVGSASPTSPIPRFSAAAQPPDDCTLIGDCHASYFPQLNIDLGPLQFTLPAGSLNQALYVPVRNTGGGVLYWTASVGYTNGTGWLQINPAQGTNNGTIRVDAYPGNLTPGTYQATLTIDGGPHAGSRFVPIVLVITPTPIVTPPVPQIQSVLNAASYAAGPVVPGSLTTIMGSSFTGKNVSATFDGLPATILFSNANQINLVVPLGLGQKNSSQLVVTVDGISSAARTVTVAPFAPAIFTGAVLNQDSTVNSVSNGAAAGSVIYFYATGLSGVGTITARIHDRDITSLYYAGPAPGFPGVQQINVVVPADLPAMTTYLYVCGASSATPDSRICSLPSPLTLK